MTIEPTPEQREIARFPLQPLRVTAGAGTGKTTTMALRLRHLVESGVVEPEEALGITFTNKAAQELAGRLRELLPGLVEDGREVEVDTYHGFAYGLLREFGPLVGVERTASIITPGYTRQLLREALGTVEPAALDLTAPGRRVDELAALAGQLGDHLCSPEDLPTDEEDETQTQRSDMARALAAYRRRKAELGVVDYSDLVAAAHRLVADHPEVAARVRSRYRVVLLDEYQDTNPAQREMLRTVFDAGFPVTAVGDADQTIYEWRGASLQNFADFPDHFPDEDGRPAQTKHLTLNRRSCRRVIDLANRVRTEIGATEETAPLRALDDAPQGAVVVGWFRTAVDEARWISTEVGRLHEEGTPWREIGVLFRKHRQIGLVRDALERQGVPVEVASLGGLLEVPEVAELHAWLALLGRPDDGPSLMRILLGSRYRLGLGDIAPLARWVHRAHRADAGDHSPVRPSLLEAIDHLDDCEGPTDRAVERLVAFRRTYRSLLEFAQGTSLVELSRIVLDRTGAWPEVEALDEAARLSARLNLYRFLDLAEEWSPLEGRPSLEAFLDYLDLLQEDRSADELDTARVGGEDAVALLTVHRAKGLEWPVVFLPSLCDGTFPSGSGGYPDPVAKPQYLPYELRLDSEYLPALPENESERRDLLKALHAGQEWRTAYVAVTRAARRLVATGAFWYTAKRPKSPSRILELALETPGAEIVEMVSAPGDPPDTLRFATDTSEGPDAVFSDGWREALRGAVAGSFLPAERAKELGLGAALEEARGQLRLVLDGLPTAPTGPGPPEPLRTSVTGLVTFAACPQRFHWSEVDRLPRRPSAALRHGLEVHRRIELHHRGAVPFEEAREGFFDVGPGERGEPGAFGAFLSSRYAELKPILVEAPFTLRIGGASIAGRIDAVYEAEPGWWEVVDFKTGRPSDDPARRVQLQAYAVAIMESGFGGGPPRDLRVAFVHLGNGVEVLAEDVDDGWLADAREHLADLVTRAAAGERDARPSAACRSCDFSRFCEPGRRWLAKHTRPDSG